MYKSLSIAVLLLTLGSPMFATPAIAGPGHDHGDGPATAAAPDAPRRLPDGSIFLPKPAQRQLQIRTEMPTLAVQPRTLELSGRVVADANTGGKVQPTQAGRIEAGPRGLPSLGQSVKQGEVLAYVRPAESARADLQASLEQAKLRLARVTQLEGSVPKREIDQAKLEVANLTQRLSSSGNAAAREALLAPISGVIGATHAVAGQVVESRELIFEVIDPSRLQVEALVHDTAQINDIAGASVSSSDGTSIPLQWVGAGRVLRDGALPVQFRLAPGKSKSPVWFAGQPLRVFAHTRSTIKGYAIPAAAVVRNASNQDIVWTHTGAEQFAPRTVRWVPLDGARVAVVDGLADGTRVVREGASLLNQIR